MSHPFLLQHGFSQHPENPHRLSFLLQRLLESKYVSCVSLSEKRSISVEELCLVHEKNAVENILSYQGTNFFVDPETPCNASSILVALHAAGLGLCLVDDMVSGVCQIGMALIRPPGHHAGKKPGYGFCIWNNIALAVHHAFKKGISRILLIDFDVHHGNGTQEIFWEDKRVLMCDLHQKNLFPHSSGGIHETGALNNIINFPLPPGSQDEDYLFLLKKVIYPIAKHFVPECIFISAGYDAHERDPLGGMNLTTQGFGLLAAFIKKMADEFCDGKILFFLEGGYDVFDLSRNIIATLDGVQKDSFFSKKLLFFEEKCLWKRPERIVDFAHHFRPRTH